jgi:hypothetical protein
MRASISASLVAPRSVIFGFSTSLMRLHSLVTGQRYSVVCGPKLEFRAMSGFSRRWSGYPHPFLKREDRPRRSRPATRQAEARPVPLPYPSPSALVATSGGCGG